MTTAGGGRRAGAVALGGALGTGLRYLAAEVWPVATATFPVTTLTVNVAGSFLLGAWAAVAAARWPHAGRLHAFVAVGTLGSFTTFSTVGLEASFLFEAGDTQTAGVYLGGTVLGGALAVLLGALLGRRVAGAPTEPR